jgi:hypothetical protein
VADVTETEAFKDAHARLRRAREHFDQALTVAEHNRFDAASDIRSDCEALADRIATLEARPLDLAERARERAQAASSTQDAVDHWESALAYYRTALEAGWGVDADFDGGTDALRMQIEWVVATIVGLHRSRAEELVASGDEVAWTDSDTATDRYETACDHLRCAHDLAIQYRAGDAEALADWLARLDRKCTSIDR